MSYVSVDPMFYILEDMGENFPWWVIKEGTDGA